MKTALVNSYRIFTHLIFIHTLFFAKHLKAIFMKMNWYDKPLSARPSVKAVDPELISRPVSRTFGRLLASPKGGYRPGYSRDSVGLQR